MSIKDNYLNPIELAGLYHAAINGTVSKNDLSETQRLQLLKFAKDKKQDIEFGIFETINSGKLTPSMYKNDLTAFIEKQSVLPQSVIDWLSETTLKPNPNNPLKLEFTSRKIKEFVLELSEFGGDENPVTYLNAWLEKLQSIGIKTFEYECLITIYHAFKENASLFWNNSHMNNIKEWLISNNAGIHPIDFGNVWDEVSRIKRIYTNKNSIYKAEFDKLKIESEAIEPIDGKILFWAKELAKFKQNLSFETLNASGDVVAYTKVNAPLFLDRLIEEEINYLKTIRDLNTTSDKTKEMDIEQEMPNFTNNFDKIKPIEIYKHFKVGLVEKGYLTEQELNEYLKAAFELKTIPETLFKIKDAPNKPTIEAVFYRYYKNVAGKVHGKQNQYAALLGDYFEGYKTTTVSSNFSKSVY